MAILLISTFDISGLTTPELGIVKAAVLYAKQNRQTQTHTINIDVFCHLAGLPSLPAESLELLLAKARRTLGIIEEVDTSAPDRDDLAFASWPVFNLSGIQGSNVKFEICDLTFNDVHLAELQNLRSSISQRHRR